MKCSLGVYIADGWRQRSTRTAIAHGLRLLMENPDQLQHLVDHPEDIPAAVEEMLRYNTAFIAMRRTATQDVEWQGYRFSKGDKIVLHYHAVNHDEDVFGDDALTFDIHRMKRMPTLNREIRSFGTGQHFCLGINLARLEMRIMFEELLPRLRNPRLAGDITYMRIVLHFDHQIDADRIYARALESTSRTNAKRPDRRNEVLKAREGELWHSQVS